MRLQNFINEGRSKEMDFDEAMNFLEKNCQKSIHQPWSIYRGMNSEKPTFYYVRPSRESERESPNSQHNYYNLFFSNHPSWKNYPKRNKSIICSTSVRVANNYGERAYYVFPVDNAKIGVCPDDDVWVSFGNDISLDTLNEMLYGIFKAVDILPSTWTEMREGFALIDNQKEDIPSFLADVGNQYIDYNEFFTYVVPYFENDGDFEDVLAKRLDPNENGFKLIKIGAPQLSSSHEIWTDADSILMPITDDFEREFIDRFGVQP